MTMYDDEISVCKCGHDTYRHFKDPHLDFIFCMSADCECLEDNPEYVDGTQG